MRTSTLVLGLILGLSALSAARDKPNGCSGIPNNSPVLELEAKELGKVKNGQSWKMDDGHGNFLYIAKVSGTPYEMGYAQGELFG